MLKLLVFLHSCKKLAMSIRLIWFVHIVPQQSHKNFSICSVDYVSQYVSQFEIFNHVFGFCWYQQWRQVFLSTKVLYYDDQLIPQSHELVEIGLSLCKILYESELFDVFFSWKHWVLHPKNWNHKKTYPNLSVQVPVSSKLVQVGFSKEAVVL